MDAIGRRLWQLKSTGFVLEQCLDIGAYRGDFTRIVKALYPECRVQQFEADERNRSYIPHAVFALLGDQEREAIFYTLPDHACTTGSSIFRENTSHYVKPIQLSLPMTTLDKVADYAGDWSKGLVKMDTQGSEMMILKGAYGLMKKRPRFFLIECSVLPYNEGAPLINQVIASMSNLGYGIRDFWDMNYDSMGNLLQTDILFEVR